MVRAKLRCDSVQKQGDGSTWVNMAAVISDDPNSENKSFADATPCANYNMVISPGKDAADYFEQGKEYYLDFKKVEDNA